MTDVPSTEGVYWREEDRELLERVKARPESYSAFMRRAAAFILAFLDILEHAGVEADAGEDAWEAAELEERVALILYEKLREDALVDAPAFREE